MSMSAVAKGVIFMILGLAIFGLGADLYINRSIEETPMTLMAIALIFGCLLVTSGVLWKGKSQSRDEDIEYADEED